jgi:type III secretion system YscQ/HrcQ family protein
LLLDRVGPDPFDPTDLGAIVTVRWAVRLGVASGTARLWIAESALRRFAADERPATGGLDPVRLARAGSLSSSWRAEAGSVPMPQGLGRLRLGGVLPLSGSRLAGSPQSPTGPIRLVCEIAGAGGTFVVPAEPLPNSSGRYVRVTGPPRHEPSPRDPLHLGINNTMTPHPDPPAGRTAATAPAPDSSPADVPVTLAVELGRLNLTLGRLADLKPGDVLELGRHSREPVELTSNGRLVARGELVLIDTELGVRITHLFL